MGVMIRDDKMRVAVTSRGSCSLGAIQEILAWDDVRVVRPENRLTVHGVIVPSVLKIFL
jgi:hypothetical protein